MNKTSSSFNCPVGHGVCVWWGKPVIFSTQCGQMAPYEALGSSLHLLFGAFPSVLALPLIVFSFYVLKLENGRAARWEGYGDFLLTEKTEAGTLLPWGPPPGVNLSQITPDTCHGQQWLLCEARRLIFSTEGKQKPKHRGHPACSCRLLLTLLQVDDPGPLPCGVSSLQDRNSSWFSGSVPQAPGL